MLRLFKEDKCALEMPKACLQTWWFGDSHSIQRIFEFFAQFGNIFNAGVRNPVKVNVLDKLDFILVIFASLVH